MKPSPEQHPTKRDRVYAAVGILLGVILGILLISFIDPEFFPWESFPTVEPSVSPSVIPSATPSPLNAGLLDGAVFYKGPRPEAKDVSYLDDDGNNRTILAAPGQVMVRAPSGATRAEVEKSLAATGVGYKILAAVPSIGSYLVQVPEDQVAYFINMLDLMDKGYSGRPNEIVSLAQEPTVTQGSKRLVLLDDTNIPDCGEWMFDPSFFRSPDPSAQVVTALIDNFNRDEKDKLSHGENTEAALRANCGGCAITDYALSGGSVAFDEIERALIVAISNAEFNGQDLVVSLSFGPSTRFNAGNSQDAADFNDAAARNGRAGRQWLDWMIGLLSVLSESDWALAGHVRLHNSAGNGALLCDAPTGIETLCSNAAKIKRNVGVDLSAPMAALLGDNVYGPLMRNNMKVWCAYAHGTTTIASYSNYAVGMNCKEPYGDLEGTSFSAPIGAGEDFVAVKKRVGEGPPTPTAFPTIRPTCQATAGVYPTPIVVTIRPTVTATPTPTPAPVSGLCSSDLDCKTFLDRHPDPTQNRILICASDHLCHDCFATVSGGLDTITAGSAHCITGCENCVDPNMFCEEGVCLWKWGYRTTD